MLDRLLIKNVAVYSAHYAVRFLFPLIATPFLAHVLTRDKFSEFAIINSCIWTSSVFIEFGFYIYGVTRVGAVGENREMLGKVVSGITYSKLFLSPFAAAVYLILSCLTGVIVRAPAATVIGLVSMLLSGASFTWFFQGRQRGAFVIVSESAPLVVQLLLLLWLVRSPDELWLAIAIQALAPLVSLSAALITISRDGLLGRPMFTEVRSLLREASPYFIERLSYSTYTSIMPSLIVLLASRSAVADYSVGERFGTLLVGLSGPLSQAALPRVARAARGGAGGWRLPIGLVIFITAVTAVFALGLGFSSKLIVDHFFPQGYERAVVVAQIFCVTACFATLGYSVTNFILIPRGKARVMYWSSGFAFVFGLAAQIVLVPRWGAQGAALGRLVSEAVVALVMCVAAFRLVRETRAPGRRDAG
ncbi:oligosaccharide flippase family protein [Phenylobacterium sp.]|uniref:oligosaccharide flippase family protein n=1 Tax=Phenylobacterium sp. TaxID=1871053 RepID=UPI002F41C0D2